MKITKEQRAACAATLSGPWGRVKLLCDGYEVVLTVECYKPLKYRVMTYVNGFFKGEWISAEKTYPEQKFLRKSVRPVYSAAFIRKMEKAVGKRWVAQEPVYKKTITTYMPDWA
ncbi:MAG: hypothetical protein PHP93_08040, partial [Kiritimatiellales bacterium]|nr:hypothetical protein [Kiritimatiellales bacterium]